MGGNLRSCLEGQNVRVTSSNVLIVPPFECAWLSDEILQLKEGAGCLDVSVKGENDVTIIFKGMPGSKRLQHTSNYTVILGSHRNSCLKFERDTVLCQQVENVPGARVSKDEFTRFWINYNKGSISVGAGPPGTAPWYTWTDSEPLKDIQHVGLSAWDRHVAYKDIKMHATLPLSAGHVVGGAGRSLNSIQSLEVMCCTNIRETLGAHTVCAALEVVHRLEPALPQLQASLLSYLAGNFDSVVDADPEGFFRLPAALLAVLLRQPFLECSEKRAFDVVVAWAAARVGSQGLADLEALLPLIRFPLMSDSELAAVLEHPFTADHPTLLLLVEEARHRGGDTSPQSGLLPCLSVEAKRHVRAAELDKSDAAVRFQRRVLPSCTELMYGWDGDCNGVIYHIGCNFGKSAWVNPVLAGRLTVKASSPVCRHTDPRALVSGSFLRANWAGPARVVGPPKGQSAECETSTGLVERGPNSPDFGLRLNSFQDSRDSPCCRAHPGPRHPHDITDAGGRGAREERAASQGGCGTRGPLCGDVGHNGRKESGAGKSDQDFKAGCSWWLLDLGPSVRLHCNYYTLRHDGSWDYLRCWALQGSNDGKMWTDLRKHVNDSTIRMVGQYASWPLPVTGHPPFRMFRILLLGPNASPGSRKDTIALSGWELYGYLSRA
eukprot:jgi/Botrbrau1/123/Bobra.0022s0109.1